MIHQAYKYEIKPSKAQEAILRKAVGTARFAYNWGLSQQFKALNKGTKFPNSIALHKALNRIKKTDYPWMYEVSKCAPQGGLRNLDKAWANKRAGRARCPRFKKKGKSRQSFTVTGSLWTKGKTVHVPRIGQVRTKEDTSKLQGRILSATISYTAGHWFISFSVEREDKIPCNKGNKPIGIDLGVSDFATDQRGRTYNHSISFDAQKGKLQKLHRSLARKERGSNNRRKAANKLAKYYYKMRNRRKDYLHKLSTYLTKTKSIICVEDLNVQGLKRGFKSVRRALAHLSWGEFVRMLEYKSEWYGAELRKIDRWFPSSKMCCACGFVYRDLVLGEEKWTCANCGSKLPRDANAATNILLEGCTNSELEHYYPEFQGNLRLWRSGKTHVSEQRSPKQEASRCPS